MVTIDCAACKHTFEIEGFEGEVTCPKCDTTMQVVYGDEDPQPDSGDGWSVEDERIANETLEESENREY